MKAPGDFHPPLYLATLSASPTTIVALRTTQTTNQGFVSFAASPNNTLERVTVAPAIRPATSGLIVLPSVPPAEQVRLLRSLSDGSSTGFHSLTGWAASRSTPFQAVRRKHRQWSRHQSQSLHLPADSQRHGEGPPQHQHSRGSSDSAASSRFIDSNETPCSLFGWPSWTPPLLGLRSRSMPGPPLVRAGQVAHAQPQAPGVPEEGERDQRRERDPDHQLRGERQPDHPVEREDGSHRHAGGDRVVEVDRADEVALRAFVAEPTRLAARVHGEPAGVERRAAAARAAQAEPAPEDAEHTPRPASVRASVARCAPVQIEEPTSGRADDGGRRRHEEEEAPAEGAACGRHQRAS